MYSPDNFNDNTFDENQNLTPSPRRSISCGSIASILSLLVAIEPHFYLAMIYLTPESK